MRTDIKYYVILDKGKDQEPESISENPYYSIQDAKLGIRHHKRTHHESLNPDWTYEIEEWTDTKFTTTLSLIESIKVSDA